MTLRSDLLETPDDYNIRQVIKNIELHPKRYGDSKVVTVMNKESNKFFMKDELVKRTIDVHEYRMENGDKIKLAYNKKAGILHLFILD